MAGDSGALDALRARLTGLSEMLGEREAPAVAVSLSLPAARAPSLPCHSVAGGAASRRGFSSTVGPGASVLRSSNAHVRDTPLGGLLQKHRDAEAQWLKDKARLALEAKGEATRRLKAEAELRRVQEQLAYRLGEVKHLKDALKGRDCRLQDLSERLRAYEQEEAGERTAAEAVRQAQAERDELRGAMAELLQRLSSANGIIGQADASMAALEEQLEAAGLERRRAEEETAAARAEADALREEAADLRWRCGLLQQLSDLTLRQNDEKTATLRQLLESESLLDDEGAAAGPAGGEGEEQDGSDAGLEGHGSGLT